MGHLPARCRACPLSRKPGTAGFCAGAPSLPPDDRKVCRAVDRISGRGSLGSIPAGGAGVQILAGTGDSVRKVASSAGARRSLLYVDHDGRPGSPCCPIRIPFPSGAFATGSRSVRRTGSRSMPPDRERGAGPWFSTGGAAASAAGARSASRRHHRSDAGTCVTASRSVTRPYQFGRISTRDTLVTFEMRSKLQMDTCKGVSIRSAPTPRAARRAPAGRS